MGWENALAVPLGIMLLSMRSRLFAAIVTAKSKSKLFRAVSNPNLFQRGKDWMKSNVPFHKICLFVVFCQSCVKATAWGRGVVVSYSVRVGVVVGSIPSVPQRRIFFAQGFIFLVVHAALGIFFQIVPSNVSSRGYTANVKSYNNLP